VPRHIWNRQRWLLILLVAAPLLGLVGVVAAEVVPDGRIAAQLVSATRRGELRSDEWTRSLLGMPMAHWGECLGASIGLGDPPGNPVKQALYSASSRGCGPLTIYLGRFAATGELAPAGEYMRYWHGSAVLTRPALAVFGLSGTRWLAFGALALAIVWFGRAVARRFGLVATAVLVGPALLTTDQLTGSWSFVQAIGLASAWAGGVLVLTQTDAEPTWKIAALAGALGGVINAFFDVMVAIPASLALCTTAAGLGLLGRGHRPGGALLRAMAAALGGWALGFVWMWGSKWVLAWVFVDRRILENVRNQIEVRTAGEGRGGLSGIAVTGSRLNGFTKNLAYWWDLPLTPLVVAVTLAVVAVFALRMRSSARSWSPLAWTAACGAVVAAPVGLWYVALNNHVQLHFWQTYRSMAVAFGAVAAFVVAATSVEAGSRDRFTPGPSVEAAISFEPSEEHDVTPQTVAL
jgi:hypothetical protein